MCNVKWQGHGEAHQRTDVAHKAARAVCDHHHLSARRCRCCKPASTTGCPALASQLSTADMVDDCWLGKVWGGWLVKVHWNPLCRLFTGVVR